MHIVGVRVSGYPDQDYTNQRLWCYHKGVSYYNVEVDRLRITQSIPPQLRPGLLYKIPKAWHEEVLKAPFDWGRYIEMFLKVEAERPDMGLNWWKAIRDDFIESAEYREKTRPRTVEERLAMSDAELKRHIAEVTRLETSSFDPPWNGLMCYMGESLGWIGWICTKWYTGGRPNIFMDLITGTRHECITGVETYASWELANMVYNSPEMNALFEKYPDARFLEYVDQCLDGPAFRAKYEEHVRVRGHRGHPDRDIYFDRRADNVMVDMRLFRGPVRHARSARPGAPPSASDWRRLSSTSTTISPRNHISGSSRRNCSNS